MKFNYLWYKDALTKKIFVVTVAYEGSEYSFAVQSLKDNHCKKIGRELAEKRLIEGLYVTCKEGSMWNDIKNSFEEIRLICGGIVFDCSEIELRFKFPSHLLEAELLSRKDRLLKKEK